MTSIDYSLTDLTDSDWQVFAGWIKGVLLTATPTITFTKKDGTERVMRCTLREDVLPPAVQTESVKPVNRSATSISVYDIDANAWRSFITTSVKRVQFSVLAD